MLVSSDALADFSHDAGVISRQTEPRTDTQAVSAAVGTTTSARALTTETCEQNAAPAADTPKWYDWGDRSRSLRSKTRDGSPRLSSIVPVVGVSIGENSCELEE